jgi:hypothetical protein
MSRKLSAMPQYWPGLRFMPDPEWPRADVIKVEEFAHALLVIGTSDNNLAARELARQDSRVKSQQHALNFPRRPFHHHELGSCVAFYFSVGPSHEELTPKQRNKRIKEMEP